MHAHRPTIPAAFAALVALATPALAQDSGRAIDVRIDRRIELMSLVFRLAGNPEYRQAKVDSYTAAVDEHFGPFADDPVVVRARELRRTRGVSFDAPMSFAVHLDASGRDLRFAVPLDPWPEDLDSRWTESDAKAFLRDANRFARKSKLDAFLREHRELYELACERAEKMLAEHAKLEWFDEFFGERPNAKFTLCLGLLNGPSNYGPRMRARDGHEELYSVLGVWKTDDEGLPVFDASVVSTIVHEFCHSYCNHLVDAHLDELRESGERIWPHVADDMRAQAYGNWQTMMREALVRGCVVRYMAATGGANARDAAIRSEVQRGFLWTGDLAELLAEYEEDREHYRDLAAFMPRVVAMFAAYPEKLEAELERTPKVVSIVPANGQQDVDPASTAITVTFDRPMLDGAWAVVGGGPHFPETTGRPSYDETHTVLTIPVRLKPDWSYELWLNRGRFDSFQSEERVKLRPVQVTFRTRG